MTARPPDFSTAAATASESVATTASPILAACARRSTCTIIGRPRDIGQGLAGQAGGGHAGRDEDDGVGHRLWRSAGPERMSRGPRRLYGLPERRQTGICPPPPSPWRLILPLPVRAPLGSLFSMNSFELNKVLGAILGTCLITLALNIGAGAIFAPEKPAKPGYAIAVKARGRARSRPPRRPKQPMERAGQGLGGKGPGDRQAVPGLPHLREGRPQPGRSQSLGHRRPAARGEDRGGFNFSAAMKAKGGNWTFDELDKFLTDPRGYIPGTAMTFAGCQERPAARRRDRFPAHAVGQPAAAADKRRRMRRPRAAAAPAEAPKPGAAPARRAEEMTAKP